MNRPFLTIISCLLASFSLGENHNEEMGRMQWELNQIIAPWAKHWNGFAASFIISSAKVLGWPKFLEFGQFSSVYGPNTSKGRFAILFASMLNADYSKQMELLQRIYIVRAKLFEFSYTAAQLYKQSGYIIAEAFYGWRNLGITLGYFEGPFGVISYNASSNPHREKYEHKMFSDLKSYVLPINSLIETIKLAENYNKYVRLHSIKGLKIDMLSNILIPIY